MPPVSTRSLVPCPNSNPQRSFSMDQPIRTLRDFLEGDLNSCSSNGFKSLPRKPCVTTIRRLIELDLSESDAKFKLQRSWSASAIQRASEIVINAVRNLQSSAVRSPSALQRSISRRISQRKFWSYEPRAEGEKDKVTVTVKVKDILRWRSFRDLIEEKPPPVDLSPSPNRCTTTTTESTSTATSSDGSSWCESDFTAENSPPDEFNCEDHEALLEKAGKKFLPEGGVGVHRGKATTGATVDPKDELFRKVKEQQRPLPGLDFPVIQHEETSSSFRESLACMQRRQCMLMQKIQEIERLTKSEPINLETEEEEEEEEESNGFEGKAKRLLRDVKKTSPATSFETVRECLLLDFFRHELTIVNQKGDELDSDMVRVAKSWVEGDYDGLFEWELEENRNAYMRDMETGVRWTKFTEEQEELALEMEIGILINLVDEVLVDLFIH